MPLFCYLLKIGAKTYKSEELLASLETLPGRFRHERGCQGYHIYQDLNSPDSFTLVAEWWTYQDMQKHFRSHDFKILVGAARVLGVRSELLITEAAPFDSSAEKGGHDE